MKARVLLSWALVLGAVLAAGGLGLAAGQGDQPGGPPAAAYQDLEPAYDAYIKGADVKNWVDKWVKLHGNKADKDGRYPYYTEGCAMYSAVTIMLQAIESTKGDTTPAILRAALKKGKFKTPWGPVSFSDGRVGTGNTYILKAVKDGNTYTRTDVFKYENVVRDEPANAKNAAPKM